MLRDKVKEEDNLEVLCLITDISTVQDHFVLLEFFAFNVKESFENSIHSFSIIFETHLSL